MAFQAPMGATSVLYDLNSDSEGEECKRAPPIRTEVQAFSEVAAGHPRKKYRAPEMSVDDDGPEDEEEVEAGSGELAPGQMPPAKCQRSTSTTACQRNAACVRGFNHGGKGGRCKVLPPSTPSTTVEMGDKEPSSSMEVAGSDCGLPASGTTGADISCRRPCCTASHPLICSSSVSTAASHTGYKGVYQRGIGCVQVLVSARSTTSPHHARQQSLVHGRMSPEEGARWYAMWQANARSSHPLSFGAFKQCHGLQSGVGAESEERAGGSSEGRAGSLEGEADGAEDTDEDTVSWAQCDSCALWCELPQGTRLPDESADYFCNLCLLSSRATVADAPAVAAVTQQDVHAMDNVPAVATPADTMEEEALRLAEQIETLQARRDKAINDVSRKLYTGLLQKKEKLLEVLTGKLLGSTDDEPYHGDE